jgi:hypothetical protein
MMDCPAVMIDSNDSSPDPAVPLNEPFASEAAPASNCASVTQLSVRPIIMASKPIASKPTDVGEAANV